MAYTPMYPTYQPFYQSNYQPQNFQPAPPAQQPAPSTVQSPQIQQGGFVRVRDENEARQYPVAPGNSVTFIDDAVTHVFVKTMGFSPMESPRFEKYRIVKEEESAQQPQNYPQNAPQNSPVDLSQYATKAELGVILSEIDVIKKEIEKTAPKKTAVKAKKEGENDE